MIFHTTADNLNSCLQQQNLAAGSTCPFTTVATTAAAGVGPNDPDFGRWDLIAYAAHQVGPQDSIETKSVLGSVVLLVKDPVKNSEPETLGSVGIGLSSLLLLYRRRTPQS